MAHLANIPPMDYDYDVNDSGSDESDDVAELPVVSGRYDTIRPRMSVSGEVPTFGFHAYNGPVTHKTAEQERRIRESIAGSYMFSSLDENDIKTVIGACQEISVVKDQIVILEGEEGDWFYLVEKGEFDCLKGDKLLVTVGPGDSFGELALMYNAPRAATVKARSSGILWRLDRIAFNHIVHHAGCAKRDMYSEFVSNVEVLQELDAYEKSKVCDALKRVTFKSGEVIIKEGDQGDRFYIIQEGTAEAIKHNRVVANYKRGDYFGELALMTDEPRAATVICKDDCTALYLDRKSFKRLLGPLENILRRNAAKYQIVLARSSVSGGINQ
eukprot:GDKJ01058293.1.p1 GENE.GDKJ01058293.1~~GDKJ01058293.1.p1  ORF type:complete len:328 (-),score=84.05 GDKJ01058293.1:628-1611(-)